MTTPTAPRCPLAEWEARQLPSGRPPCACADGAAHDAAVAEAVRDGVGRLPPLDDDPLFQMIGVDDVEPANA